MTIAADMDHWEHQSGYWLNADGKAMRYEHNPSGMVAHVEAMIDEERGRLEYRPALFYEGEMLEYPPVFYDKGRALSKLKEMMQGVDDERAQPSGVAV